MGKTIEANTLSDPSEKFIPVQIRSETIVEKQGDRTSRINNIYFSDDNLSIDKISVNGLSEAHVIQLNEEYPVNELSHVYFEGVQYYDLKNIGFINNTGIAKLIDLLKSLLQEGVDVRFVNVNEKIRNKIRSMNLDNILNCS